MSDNLQPKEAGLEYGGLFALERDGSKQDKINVGNK